MAGNPNFDSLLSTTLDKYIPTLVDNAFSSQPGLWTLKREGRIQNQDGGLSVVVPLQYAESKNHGSYSGSDTFSTEDDDNITAAQYNWAQYYALIKIVGIDEAKNSGSKTQVLNLVKARVKSAEMTISENIDEMLFGDGSGNNNKDFIGLKAIVSDGNPSWGNLGGIDATATGNDFWKSTVDTTSENWSTWGFTGMSKMWLAVSEGADHPTHLFTTADLLATIEGNLTQNARYLDPETADAGFQHLLWKGVPIIYDKYVDSGYLYMVNIDYITLMTLAGVWFKPSGLLEPVNQDVKYKTLKCYGQIVTDNRKRHGLHTNLTAA